MRILIANKYYYPRGGDCIYTIELERLLREKGHEVAVFAMEHPSNLSSAYSAFFPGEIDFGKKNISTFLTALMRPFGTREVKRKFRYLLRDFKPDIIHMNNIHSQLSPVIAVLAKKFHIPVVWTLHDGKLVCPAYLFLSNNKICEDCVAHSKINVLKKRCIKRSFFASLLGWLESLFWNREKLSEITGTFITPSIFLQGKMIMDGYNSLKIKVLNNFISNTKYELTDFHKKDHYCFIGRISSEKGIEDLLKAASALPECNLKIIGTGPMEEDLKHRYENGHIEFLGYRNWNEIREILSASRCMVIPSNCYENNPLTILESLCLGTPVIGTDLGGIPELITPDVNGLLFESGNVEELKDKIRYMMKNHKLFSSPGIAREARLKYSSDRHYELLTGIYNELLQDKIR